MTYLRKCDRCGRTMDEPTLAWHIEMAFKEHGKGDARRKHLHFCEKCMAAFEEWLEKAFLAMRRELEEKDASGNGSHANSSGDARGPMVPAVAGDKDQQREVGLRCPPSCPDTDCDGTGPCPIRGKGI